jgi:hypothetical protein
MLSGCGVPLLSLAGRQIRKLLKRAVLAVPLLTHSFVNSPQQYVNKFAPLKIEIVTSLVVKSCPLSMKIT